MSRKGNKPIAVEENVEVTFNENVLTVKGPKGELTQAVPQGGISVERDNGQIIVSNTSTHREGPAFHGLYRSLLANMIEGVSKGFEVNLELYGVGYRAQMKGNDLNLALGFSHPVDIKAPEGITFTLEGQTNIKISGINKQTVGHVAAEIVKVRPAKKDPYKQKGVRYKGQYLRKKAGKKVK
ncbi:MAG: 50S ribosomal protein L6 [bacterium]|nr:50S ribosomal protein L6 [bacterium]